MAAITNRAELKEAIRLLEIKQAEGELALKQQFHHVYESLKPANIIKGTLKEIISPALNNSIADTALGMTTGYVAKKVLTGAFSNPFVKVLGILLQIGVSNIVTKHPGAIKPSGRDILNRIFRKPNSNDVL